MDDKPLTTVVFLLALASACSGGGGSSEQDSSSEASQGSGDSSSHGTASESGSETHDPRCDFLFPNDESPDCEKHEGQIWWAYSIPGPGTDSHPRCEPSYYGPTCDDPKIAFPFASLEECLAACPDAFNLVKDDLTLKVCSEWFGDRSTAWVDRVTLDPKTGQLTADVRLVSGCPLHGPIFEICYDEETNNTTPDGKPFVHLRIVHEIIDNCDFDPVPFTRTFDISSLLQDITERPLSIEVLGNELSATIVVQ